MPRHGAAHCCPDRGARSARGPPGPLDPRIAGCASPAPPPLGADVINRALRRASRPVGASLIAESRRAETRDGRRTATGNCPEEAVRDPTSWRRCFTVGRATLFSAQAVVICRRDVADTITGDCCRARWRSAGRLERGPWQPVETAPSARVIRRAARKSGIVEQYRGGAGRGAGAGRGGWRRGDAASSGPTQILRHAAGGSRGAGARDLRPVLQCPATYLRPRTSGGWVADVNARGYGLTFGMHSRIDDRGAGGDGGDPGRQHLCEPQPDRRRGGQPAVWRTRGFSGAPGLRRAGRTTCPVHADRTGRRRWPGGAARP